MSDETWAGRRVGRFEDLVAWQRARVLTCEIYKVTGQGRFARDHGLAGQIQRAAVSVMSNIAEGFERGSATEFCRFLWTAKSSCAEVRSQLYVAHDIGYVNRDKFRTLLTNAEEVGRIIGGPRTAVARKKGAK